MKAAYPIVMSKGKGHIVVFIPDFNINTQGKDYAEAMEMARDAIGLMGSDMEASKERIPAPSDLLGIQKEHQDDVVSLVDVDFSKYQKRVPLKLVYPACFYQDAETGAYTVEIPDLPGCVSGGPTLTDAIRMAEDAASGWVLDELEDGKPAPAASELSAIHPNDGGFVSLLCLELNPLDSYCYPAVFTYEDGKEISVEFPDLGCATSGESDADALRSARELLGLVISGLLEDGEALPAPTPLYLIPLLEHQRSALVAI